MDSPILESQREEIIFCTDVLLSDYDERRRGSARQQKKNKPGEKAGQEYPSFSKSKFWEIFTSSATEIRSWECHTAHRSDWCASIRFPSFHSLESFFFFSIQLSRNKAEKNGKMREYEIHENKVHFAHTRCSAVARFRMEMLRFLSNPFLINAFDGLHFSLRLCERWATLRHKRRCERRLSELHSFNCSAIHHLRAETGRESGRSR